MKKYVNWSIFAVAGALLAIAVQLFHFFVLPIAIHYQVRKTLALENGTEAWDRFVETPIPIIMKLYFFKVENPEEMLKGAKPKVSEVGPYVYKEVWKKHDIQVVEETDRIFYRQGIEFIFDKELSEGRSEYDLVTTINPIIHILSQVIEGFPTINLMEELIEYGIPSLLGDMWGPTLTFKVRDFLFDGISIGCNNTNLKYLSKLFCSALRHYQPLPIFHQDEHGNLVTAALKFKEMSELYEIVMGKEDPQQMGKIVSINHKNKYDYWHCDSANIVNGYDMTMFPSFLTEDSVIPFFSPDILTSVDMVYKDDIKFQGISGFKYGLGGSFMADVREDPNAKCYCPGKANGMTIPEPCFDGKGVVSLAGPLGIPAILSLPHFYEASDNWVNGVEGIKPDPALHESFLEIEPTTGVPMRGFRRIQINVHAKKLTAINLLRNHATALVPIVWMEEGTQLGDKEISLLRDQLLTVLGIVTIVRWTLFGVGIAIFFLGTGMAILRRRQELADEARGVEAED